MNQELTAHSDFFNSEEVKANLEAVLNSPKKALQFKNAMLQIVNSTDLIKVAPKSVYLAAMTAASLNLEVNPLFGYVYFLPYRNYKTGQTTVQFILGYKGLIQLALRSNSYESINSVEIYENQFISWNFLTETLEVNVIEGEGQVVGYYAYFKQYGFEKRSFWTVKQVEKFALKYSNQKKDGNLINVWKSEFNKMACKTVLKNILIQYGVLSQDMKEALSEEAITNKIQDIEVVDVSQPISEVQFLTDLLSSANDLEALQLLKNDIYLLADDKLTENYKEKISEYEI